MSEETLCLDSSTEQLIQKIHQTVLESQSKDLDIIRDALLQRQAELGGVITAFLEVAELRQLPRVGKRWRELEKRGAEEDERLTRAQKRQTADRAWKWKHFCFISIVWGSDVVRYYGFAKIGQTKMTWLYHCATKWPTLSDFVRIANVLLFLRHLHAVAKANPPSRHVAGRPAAFMGNDIKHISKISRKSERVYGEEFSTGVLERRTQELNDWTTNVDGSVLLKGRTLKEWQPRRYAMYLLEKDRYGTLMQRDSGAAPIHVPPTPTNTGVMSPPPSLPQHRGRVRDNSDGSPAGDSADMIESPPIITFVDQQADRADLRRQLLEEDLCSIATSSTSLTPLSGEGTLVGSGASKATGMGKMDVEDVETAEMSVGEASDDLFLSRETTPGAAITDDASSEICVGARYDSADEAEDGAADRDGVGHEDGSADGDGSAHEDGLADGDGSVHEDGSAVPGGAVVHKANREDNDATSYADEDRQRLTVGDVVENVRGRMDEDVEISGDKRPALSSNAVGRAGVNSLNDRDGDSRQITEKEISQNDSRSASALAISQDGRNASADGEVDEGEEALSEIEAWNIPLVGDLDSVDDASSEMDLRMTESPSEHATTPLLLGGPLSDSMSSPHSEAVPLSCGSSASFLSGLGPWDSCSDDESPDDGRGIPVRPTEMGGVGEMALHVPATQLLWDDRIGDTDSPFRYAQRDAHPTRRPANAIEQTRGTMAPTCRTTPLSPAGQRNQYTTDWVKSNQLTWPDGRIGLHIDPIGQTPQSRATNHSVDSTGVSQQLPVRGSVAFSALRSRESGRDHANTARIRQYVANVLEQAPPLGQSHAHMARWRWLSGGKIASVPSSTISREEADVEVCTNEAFLVEASGGRAFDKPVIIKEDASDGRLHSIDSLVDELRDSYETLSVQVQDATASSRTEMAMPDFLERVQTDQGSVTPLNLFGSFCAHEPAFSRMRRFRLLDILVRRAAASGGNGEAGAVDGTRGLSRSRLETDGAFVGPHVAFGGKWTRYLAGQKLIVYVPPAAMLGEWDAFASAGAQWCPRGKQLILLLEKGDVLFVPRSHPHVEVAIGTCASIEGPVWDARDTVEYLRSARWAAENRACADVPPLLRFNGVLNALLALARSRTSRHLGEGLSLSSTHEITDKVHALVRALSIEGNDRVGPFKATAGCMLTGDHIGGGHHGDVHGAVGRLGSEKRRRVS